jgi:hypothetical protein
LERVFIVAGLNHGVGGTAISVRVTGGRFSCNPPVPRAHKRRIRQVIEFNDA